MLLMLPCLFSLLQRALQRAAGMIFLAQIQKGGIVGGCNGSAECLTVREQRDLEQLVVVTDLCSAASGSAGLYLAVTTEVVLNTPNEIKLVSTGIWGPLPKGMVGLILGRSSTSKQGILVLPGVIDSDYQGELKIMITVLFGYHVLQPGQQVAQLLLFPYWVPNSKQVP
uniref:dUTPase-like domain-containing protein n=1 Tax=Buteo japonicus TaxID=224669 RepID=A0A8C0HL91_9AVES